MMLNNIQGRCQIMFPCEMLKHICQKIISVSKWTKIVIIFLILCILFYLRHMFRLETKYAKFQSSLFKNTANLDENFNPAQFRHSDQSQKPNIINPVSNMDLTPVKVQPRDFGSINDINVLMTFTNIKTNPQLIPKFQTTISTMLKHCTASFNIYIIGDTDSQIVAEQILNKEKHHKDIQIHKVNIDEVVRDIDITINEMKKYFSSSGYYAQSLFFLSIVIHKVKAFNLDKAIFVDSDIKFNSDIQALYNHFQNFDENNIMGLAHENQPVYRHLFSYYRRHNPGTRVGSPPPNGLPGFNSGVILLDIKRMKDSLQYNKLLRPDILLRMTKTYDFKGHLGDQDFFTLLSLENEDLFYVLPCTWNRQLCVWWRDKGYEDVFDLYFKCNGKINIYHGNCNTPFPNS